MMLTNGSTDMKYNLWNNLVMNRLFNLFHSLDLSNVVGFQVTSNFHFAVTKCLYLSDPEALTRMDFDSLFSY